jgi:integrase
MPSSQFAVQSVVNVSTETETQMKERSGYVFQDKHGRWFARTTIKDSAGQRRNIVRRAKTKSDAKALLKTILQQLDGQGEKAVEVANKTFNDLCDLYERVYLHPAEYVHDRKVSGLRALDRAERAVRLFRQHFGSTKLSNITYNDLYSFRLMRLRTETQYKRPRTIASVNRELRVLRRMLNIAVRQGWIAKSPFNCGDSLISSADENMRERILSPDEELRLLAAIDSEPKRKHLRGILLLALDCALRRGEILTLRWSDINLERRTITVRSMNCKTARARTVAMTRRVYAFLQQQWLSSRQVGNELVFGIRVTVRTSFRKVCKAANVDNFHLHDCRHTAITRMIRAGLQPLEVMRVSGHTTLACLYRYANLDSDTVFRAAAALDAYHAEAAEVKAA